MSTFPIIIGNLLICMSGPMRLLFGLKVFFSGLHFLQDQLGFFGGFVGDYYIGGCGDLV